MSLEPGVNTYATAAEADAHHASRPTAGAWLAIGTSVERESWLVAAYDRINALEQGEEWLPPYPPCVIKAQSEFALELFSGENSQASSVEALSSGGHRVKKFGPGGEVEVFDDKTSAEKEAIISAPVDRLLSSRDCAGHFKVSDAGSSSGSGNSTGIIIV